MEQKNKDIKQQVKDKAVYMLNLEDNKKELEKEINRVIESGYIDFDIEEEDIIRFSKMVLYLALKRYTEGFKPLSDDLNKKYKSLIKNY